MADSVITTEDGREFEKPDTIPFRIQIGERRRPDKGYITDEQMVISTPTGWLLHEEIPQPLRQYIDSPDIESKSGDNRKWVCPAGQHIKPDRLKEIIQQEDDIQIDYWRENEGRFNQTRIALQVTTEETEVAE